MRTQAVVPLTNLIALHTKVLRIMQLAASLKTGGPDEGTYWPPATEMEAQMPKTLLLLALAIGLSSAGSLLSNRAEAGGAMIKTLGNPTRTASISPVHKRRHAQRPTSGISEYSSSSATKTKPAH
jgi:hypothetical protein